MEPMTFTIPQNAIYAILAAVFAAGVAIPSPVQPLFKAIAAIFYKKKDATPEPGKEGEITERESIERLPALVMELTKLLVSSPDARGLVTSELIKLLQLASSRAAGNLPDLLPAILGLLTTEHSRRSDVDLSKQLSESWAKITGSPEAKTAAPVNVSPRLP